MKKGHVLSLLAVIVIVGAGYYLSKPAELSPRDTFAQCIAESGATFYGAFWCSHCNDQKALFGPAQKYLPYVECSPPNRNGQKKVCVDANIQGYPTWEFADKSRETGLVPLDILSQRTNCPLPD